MIRTRMTLDRRLGALLLGLGLLAGAHAQTPVAGNVKKYSSTAGNAACLFFDGFTDNGDGTVTDARFGLMWKRCAEGSAWDGKACSVAATEMNWGDAMKAAKASRYLGHSDWQLPSQDALRTVVGAYTQCKNNRDEKKQYAASAALVHPVAANNYPGWYWSSTPFEGNGNFVWVTNFGDGYIHHDYNGYKYGVRLVRPVSAEASVFATEFQDEYLKIVSAESASLARQREAEKEDAVRRPQQELEDARRKVLQAKTEATTLLLTDGVQALYLQAGKAQRTGGGMQINGVFFSASQMYELLVERFPTHDLAIKASDQLSAIAQIETLERLNGVTQSRDKCLANVRQREASCESPSSPPGCLAYVRQAYVCN